MSEIRSLNRAVHAERAADYRLPTALHQRYYVCDMESTTAINADRFFADRLAPFCGLGVAKVFEQLRY